MRYLTPTEARVLVTNASTPFPRHPTKTSNHPDPETGKTRPRHSNADGSAKPHPYGRVVYIGHKPYAGSVGILVDGEYLMANGSDLDHADGPHASALLALAHYIDNDVVDVGIPVEVLSEDDFYARLVPSSTE